MSSSLFMQSNALKGMYPPNDDGSMRDEGLIQIERFTHEFKLPVSPLRTSFSNAAFQTGLVKHGPVTISHITDLSSTVLIKAFLKRTVIPNLQIISGIMTSAKMTPIWLLRMTNGLLTHFSYESAEDGTIMETFAIQYSSICWVIYGLRADGTLIASPASAGVDATNVIVTDYTTTFPDANYSTAKAPASQADYFDATKWT